MLIAMSDEKVDLREQELQDREAMKLKKFQDKVHKKFEFLLTVDTKHFSSVYVQSQAEEICSYLKYVKLTPFAAWYSAILKLVKSEDFLYQHYIVSNEFGEFIPDEERIQELILKDVEDIDKERENI